MRVREAATIDCYAELGVSPAASRAEITAAFRSLVSRMLGVSDAVSLKRK